MIGTPLQKHFNYNQVSVIKAPVVGGDVSTHHERTLEHNRHWTPGLVYYTHLVLVLVSHRMSLGAVVTPPIASPAAASAIRQQQQLTTAANAAAASRALGRVYCTFPRILALNSEAPRHMHRVKCRLLAAPSPPSPPPPPLYLPFIFCLPPKNDLCFHNCRNGV